MIISDPIKKVSRSLLSIALNHLINYTCMPDMFLMCIVFSQVHMRANLGKGTYWQFFHKLDSRENSLLNAANHFKIFLIGFEICLYEHLYFLYIRNPLFPIVAFISMFSQLKVNMFYQKHSFPIV